MRTNFSNPRLIPPLLLGSSLILLSGCSGDKLARTFGLTRDAPDEYTVTTRAPLSMPPDYNLRPPRPGRAAPAGAERAAAGRGNAGAADGAERPPGQHERRPGGPAGTDRPGRAQRHPQPRSIEDANNAANDDGFVDKVLYWRKPNTQNVQVDAPAEAQRLRQDAALGQPPNVGDTPIIQEKKQGWFSSLFSWL